MSNIYASHLKYIWNNEIVSQQKISGDLKVTDTTAAFKEEYYAIT